MCELNSEWIYCADRWISKVYWWLSEREIFSLAAGGQVKDRKCCIILIHFLSFRLYCRYWNQTNSVPEHSRTLPPVGNFTLP